MTKEANVFSKKGVLTIKIVGINLVAITGAVIIGARFQQMGNQFGESGFITYFSVVQLLILSYFTYKTFRIRARRLKSPWKSSIAIWGIMSLGFFFLALDDLVQIHEAIDRAIHWIGRIEETGASDRIDDLIVGLYGIIAIGLLVCYRRELKKHYRVLPYVVVGFVLMFLMVGADVLTNRDDILLTLFSGKTTGSLMRWMFVLEESLKILSEAFLIVAAYTCYQTAKYRDRRIAKAP